MRRSELSREARVSFILDARGRSRTETYDVQEIDKRTDYRCSWAEYKPDTFLLMKREDNKHSNEKIYGLCVFFKLSSGNK